MASGRPNRGIGTAGPKRPTGGGNRDQYSGGGKSTSTRSTTTKTSKK